MLGSDSMVPIIASQNSVLVDRIFGELLGEEPHPEKREHRAGLPQHAVEMRVEFQDVERPPEITVADRRRRTKREDDDGGVEDRHPRLVIEIARDEHQHGADHAHRDHEDDLLAVRHAAQRQRQHRRAEDEPAAENAPVDRPRLGFLLGDQEDADQRNQRAPPARTGTPSRARTIPPARPTIRRPPACPPTAKAGRAPAPCRVRRALRDPAAACRFGRRATPLRSTSHPRPRPGSRCRSRSAASRTHRAGLAAGTRASRRQRLRA